MADLVAWGPIRSGKNNGTEKDPDLETITIAPGETVTKDALGLDDDGWEQLIASGAVRTMSYPDMPETYQSSPVDFLRESARAAAENELMSSEMSEENIAAIIAANNASTGVALPPEDTSDTTTTSEEESTQPTTTFKTNDAGDLLASDDGGTTWRVATNAEKAAQA
jgi:hypothetical protein